MDSGRGDRDQIRDLFVDYCTALRVKDLTILDRVFTDDGVVDYTRIGGPCAGLELIKPWLDGLLAGVRHFQLFVGDSTYRFLGEGIRAEVTTTWHGIFVPAEGPTLAVYGTYDDVVARTPAGWRLRRRTDLPAVQVALNATS